MGNVKPNVEEDLRQLVAMILEVEPETIDAEANFVKDLGMDSMMALEILASIEKKYKLVIPEETLGKFTSLNQTITIVQELLNKKI
jgi:acyl carrier protein